ncbi:MAG: 50S ribosomal protein L11 methyltransferase [Hyphomicrobiaceae bacterium]|nr:50S ribosomal protein L11 methyltransferase [Hyphomicrobiaceae bacterium]
MSARRITLSVDDRDAAHTLAGALQNLIDPPPAALTLFEEPGDGWRIDAYFDAPPAPDDLRAELAALLAMPPEAVGRIALEDVPDLNWVALSQAALPPVAAGRYTVHGSHDRHRVPQGPGAILIEAGEAFGTAHHATTYGCLLAIDQLTRRRTFRNVLDLGCGSGVLAIAVHRALPHARITATDLDAPSVAVAKENARVNRCAGAIAFHVASGLAHPALRTARLDLVVANILAGPLIALALDISRAVKPGGQLILSGLLVHQAPAVMAAYRAAGFDLELHARIHEWSTLTLRRRSGLQHKPLPVQPRPASLIACPKPTRPDGH